MAVASAGPYASLHLATATPAHHHSCFLQAGCPSCRPTNSVKALMATKTETETEQYKYPYTTNGTANYHRLSFITP